MINNPTQDEKIILGRIIWKHKGTTEGERRGVEQEGGVGCRSRLASVGACEDSGKSTRLGVRPSFELRLGHISYVTLENLLKFSFPI